MKRFATMVLQPASITPDPMKKPSERKVAQVMREALDSK